MKNIFNGKGILAVLAAVAFFTGFLFVDRGSISGNTIVDGNYSVSTISLVGIVLAVLSAILVFYILRRR